MKRTYMMTGAALAFVAATTGFAVAQSGQMGQGHGPAFDFEELDSNGDAKITAEEMQSRAEARFGEADTDGDGKLSADEMAERMRARMAERMARRATRMIERMDGDDDGMVSLEEMRSGRMGQMMQRADQDGDGALSEAEFDAMHDMRKSHRKGRGQDSSYSGMKRGAGCDGEIYGKGHHGAKMKGGHHRSANEIHYHYHYYGDSGKNAGGMKHGQGQRQGQGAE